MTMKGCREVLTARISQVDPRAGLKTGFKTSQDSLIAELNDVLGEMVDLTASDGQKIIDRLAKQLFPLWLDFALHRCRIVLRLHDQESKTMAEKVAQARESSLTLTVVPLTGRYGNVKGLELENFVTIEGCAGESLTIP